MRRTFSASGYLVMILTSGDPIAYRHCARARLSCRKSLVRISRVAWISPRMSPERMSPITPHSSGVIPVPPGLCTTAAPPVLLMDVPGVVTPVANVDALGGTIGATVAGVLALGEAGGGAGEMRAGAAPSAALARARADCGCCGGCAGTLACVGTVTVGTVTLGTDERGPSPSCGGKTIVLYANGGNGGAVDSAAEGDAASAEAIPWITYRERRVCGVGRVRAQCGVSCLVRVTRWGVSRARRGKAWHHTRVRRITSSVRSAE